MYICECAGCSFIWILNTVSIMYVKEIPRKKLGTKSLKRAREIVSFCLAEQQTQGTALVKIDTGKFVSIPTNAT